MFDRPWLPRRKSRSSRSRGEQNCPKRRRQGAASRRPRFQQLERRIVLATDLITLIESDLGKVSGPIQPGDLTVSSGGNVVLDLQSPTLTFQTGSSAVQISAASASLFPNQNDFSSTVSNFTGSYDAASGSLTLDATNADITVGKILELSADSPSFSLDKAGALTISLGAATATSPDFSGASGSVSGLSITNAGIAFTEADVTDDSLTIDSVLQVDQFALDVKGFSYTTSSGLSATSATIGAGSASLFPDQKAFTATVKKFNGGYDFTSGDLTMQADDADIAVGKILDVTADSPSFSLSAAGALSIGVGSATASSPDFPGASGSVSGLSITNAGISFTEADVTDDKLTIGSILQVGNFALDVKGFSYTTGSGLSATSAMISAGSASLFPDQKAFTATVKNFNGGYDFTSGDLTLKADDVDIAVSDVLTIDATSLAFQLDPFSITIGSATASSPRFNGVGGSIDDLAITSDGFSFQDATLGPTDTVNLGSVFTFTKLQFTLTNFGFSISHGAAFGVFDPATNTFDDSVLSVSADSAALNIGSQFKASATSLSGSVDLSPDNLGDFTFKAGTVSIGVGKYLELDATGVQFDPSATGGTDIADFGSISATLNVGSLSIDGSAQDFGIDSSGQFVTQPGFAVSFSVDKSSSGTVSGEIQWPSWLPIQISQLSLAWPDFAQDPLDFKIDLSASVNVDKLDGSAISLSGYVDNAVLDTGLLAQGQFPLVGLDGVGIEAGGSMFGVTARGQLFLSMLRYDSSGKVIAEGDDTTPVAKSYLYGGIDAALNVEDEAGFEVRVGLSQLGPLQGYVSLSAPVILDPIFTGLALTDFSAGIQFDSTLPDITDARQMASEPDFVSSSKLTLLQWKSLLKTAVETQVGVQSSGGDILQQLAQPMTMEGGVTIFSAYESGATFELKGLFKFDTVGHFYAQGDLRLGGTFDLPVELYFNASDLAKGTGSILVLAQGPQEAPLFTLYGGLSFDFGDLIDSVKKDVSGAGALGPQLGTAIQLNGTNQYATAPNIDLNQKSFTAEFWAQRQDNGRAETVLSENNGIQIGFDANDDFTFTDGGATVLSYVKPDTMWHDYAVSYDDTTGAVMLYVDGAVVEQGTIAPANLAVADTTLYMGSQAGGGSGYFKGSLDEVRVWSGMRSSSDIINNMDQPVVDPTSLQQMLGYWQFEEGAGTTAVDSSPSGNTAQLVGSPQWIEADANRVTPVTLGNFTVTVNGGLELTAPSVGGVYVEGKASFNVLPGMAAIDMDLTGSMGIDPLGSLLQITGSTHLEFDAQTLGGTTTIVPEFWGAFELQPGDLTSLGKLGLNVTGTALLRFNTDTNSHSITVPGITTPVTLPASSLQFYVDGSAQFQQNGSDWFQVGGTLIASFVVTGSTTTAVTDSSGKPVDGVDGKPLTVSYDDFTLDTLLDGTLSFGPATNPYSTFTIDGFVQIADSGPDAGIAAQIDATLADAGALAKDGVDINASFYLELNTTGAEVQYTVPTGFPIPQSTTNGAVDIPAGPTDANGNEGPAGPYLILYGNGDVTLQKGIDLTGNFDLQVSAAGVTADFDSKLAVPDLGTFTATGSLTVDSSGVWGYLSLGTPDLNPGTGFTLSGTSTLEVNATANPLTVGPTSDPLDPGQVLVKVSGDLTAGGFDLHGVFDLTVESSTVDVNATGTIGVGSLGALNFNSTLIISSDGVYGDLMLGTQTLSGTAFSINGTTEIQLNTTNSVQDNMAADTVVVDVAGSAQLQRDVFGLVLLNSFTVQGTFELTAKPNYVNVAATGHVALGPLGTVSVSGDWSATSAGLWGDLQAAATALPDTTGFSVDGQMQLEVNTTTGAQAVLARPIDPTTGALGAPVNMTLAPATVEVTIGGHVSLLNSFTLAGELDLGMYPDGELNASVDANVSVFNVTVTVNGSLTVRSDASAYGDLTVSAGSNGELSFASGAFTISAEADFNFDTQNQTASFNLHGANGGPATVSFFGLTASANLTIDYSSGLTTIYVPDIQIQVPDFVQQGGATLWNKAFGNNGPFDPNAVFTFDASGFFQSDGQFELSFYGDINLGSQPFESGVGATGGFYITIGNFTGYLPTSVNLPYSGSYNGDSTYAPTFNYQYGSFSGFSAQVWAVGWVQDIGYGLMTAGVTISQNYFNVNLWAAGHLGNLWAAHEDWGWLPGINLNFSAGSPGGPAGPAPLFEEFSPSGQFRDDGSPITTVKQGTDVWPWAWATVDGANQAFGYNLVSYSEAVYYDGNLIDAQGPESYPGLSFVASKPGTYEVDITAIDNLPGGLSTTQRGDLIVNDVPPSNATFQMVNTAAVGQAVTTGSVTYDNPAGNNEYDSWTVTQHGTVVATGTGTNLSFSPQVAGTYNVEVVVSDEYGGSARASRTLTVVNAGAGLIFSNNGPVNEGSPLSVGFSGAPASAGLTYSFDFQNDGSFSDPGDVASSSSPSASYVYTTPGTHTIHGRATAPGGYSTDYYTTVTIVDPAVAVAGDKIQSTEGSATGLVTVATFTDPGTVEDTSHYSATIDWGDGATSTGSVVTNSDGNFSVEGNHIYAVSGSYPLNVTVAHDQASAASAAATATVADAPLAITGATVNGVEGHSLATAPVVVATFTDPAPEDVSQYSVELNWNDGTGATRGTIVRNGNAYDVLADHRFAEEGNYGVTVAITHSGQLYLGQANVAVADAPLVGSGIAATAVEGGTGPIVAANNVSDANTGQSPIVITTASTAGLVTGQTVTISGLAHSAANGQWAISVINGTQFSLTDSNGVSAGAYTGGGSWTASNLMVATFTDTGGREAPTDYTATIDWGDGATTAGTIGFDRVSGTPSVSGDHIYAEEGTYTVTTVITHDSAPPITTTSQMTVNDAPLTATPVTLNAVAGQALSSTVAAHIVVGSFTDADPAGAASDYKATIDWGDGSPTAPGVVAYDAANHVFVVWAASDHVYTRIGTYQVTVNLNDTGGASAVDHSTAVIEQAELEADPFAPGQRMLAIGGTTGNDQITLAAGATAGSESVTLNGVALGSFTPTSRTLIFGQAGSDQYQVDAPVAVPVRIYANTGTNSLYVAGAEDPAVAPVYNTIASGTNALTVVGDGANDRFTLADQAVTVASPLAGNQPVPIVLTNVQAIAVHGGAGNDAFTIAEANVPATLIGDTGNDSFVFDDGASITGAIIGGTGGGTNTLDWSHYTTARRIALTATGTPGYDGNEASIGGGFDNINSVIGSGAGASTLAGPNVANSWNIDAANAGSLNGRLTFSDIPNLVGQKVSDVFAFTGSGGITGSVVGGSASETLDYSAYGTPVAVRLTGSGTLHGVQGTTAGVTQSFDNIDSIVGNAGSTLGSGTSPIEFKGDLNTNLTLNGFANTQLHIAGNLGGNLTVLGTGPVQLAIDHSLTYTGVVNVAGGLTSLIVGGDLAGMVTVGGKLDHATVGGGTPGQIVAGSIGTLEVEGGYGPDVLQVKEGGIQRRVEATTPGDPYPLLAIPPQPPVDLPSGVAFQFVYEGEGTGLTNPQLTLRVHNSAGTTPDQYDLSLVTDNDVAKFNLARLDAVGVSGIRNVAVEGDLLTSVTAVANSFFVPGQTSDPPGGIQLPNDALAGVAIRDYAPNGDIQAKSIEAVAFGSHSEEHGQIVAGADSRGEDAAELLAPGTAIMPANDTFRVLFADQPTQRAGFFFDSDPRGGRFDDGNLALTVQNVVQWNGATGTAMANVTTPSNAARGAVTALIQIVQAADSHGHARESLMQQIAFNGDGASLMTWQPIAGSITSTGPLGDLRLNEGGDALDITAPSIFGSVDLGGPLAGTVQTTGLRTDPITGATSAIPADLGRLYVVNSSWGPVLSDTTFNIEGGMLAGGQLIVGGNLIGQINLDGDLRGTLAVKGNVLGGIISNGGVSGQLLLLGNVTGDVDINGALTGQTMVLGTIASPGSLQIDGGLRDGGLLALQGDVSGELEIDGGIDDQSALIAGGNLGSAAAPFVLNGDVRGILATVGNTTTKRPIDARRAELYGTSLGTNSDIQARQNAAAIDAAFSALDAAGLGLIGHQLAVNLTSGRLSFAIEPAQTSDGDLGPSRSGGFFQNLAGPSGGDELNLWAAGVAGMSDDI